MVVNHHRWTHTQWHRHSTEWEREHAFFNENYNRSEWYNICSRHFVYANIHKNRLKYQIGRQIGWGFSFLRRNRCFARNHWREQSKQPAEWNSYASVNLCVTDWIFSLLFRASFFSSVPLEATNPLHNKQKCTHNFCMNNNGCVKRSRFKTTEKKYVLWLEKVARWAGDKRRIERIMCAENEIRKSLGWKAFCIRIIFYSRIKPIIGCNSIHLELELDLEPASFAPNACIYFSAHGAIRFSLH